jgi:hypothetical protein
MGGGPELRACPITVRERSGLVGDFAAGHVLSHETCPKSSVFSGKPVIELDDIWLKYEKEMPDVVKGLPLRYIRVNFLHCWAATARVSPRHSPSSAGSVKLIVAK